MLEASGSQRCSNRSRAIRGSPFLGPVPQWWTGAFSIYRFLKIETINNNIIQLCFKSGTGQESSTTGTSLMCKYTMFHHFCTLHGRCPICSRTKRYLVLCHPRLFVRIQGKTFDLSRPGLWTAMCKGQFFSSSLDLRALGWVQPWIQCIQFFLTYFLDPQTQTTW